MSRTIHPILIVEDDAPTQTLLETLMQRHGYATALAANGRAAIDLLASRDFTAVILDLMMPQVGGGDVIEFLARAQKRVPVIVCTAAGPDKTSDFDSSVVGAVLRKPFDIEEMMSTIFALAGYAGPSKVLIVDDDARSRFALKALLAPATSLEAENGGDALAIIREHRPEAVLATERMLAQVAAEGVPVVVITSAPPSDDERETLMQRAAAVVHRRELSRQTLADVFDVVLRRG